VYQYGSDRVRPRTQAYSRLQESRVRSARGNKRREAHGTNLPRPFFHLHQQDVYRGQHGDQPGPER
jgi:hypothetical protein